MIPIGLLCLVASIVCESVFVVPGRKGKTLGNNRLRQMRLNPRLINSTLSNSDYLPGSCKDRCVNKYPTPETGSTPAAQRPCRKQCMESENPGYEYCKYTSVANCKKYYVEDDNEYNTYTQDDWNAACEVSCSKELDEDETEDCVERCEDIDNITVAISCIDFCASNVGRCPYNSYSDCKDQYDEDLPFMPSVERSLARRNDEGPVKISDYYAEDDWKDYCKAICPRASVWWVALIVLLVLAIAAIVVLVILLLICRAKAAGSSNSA